MKKINILILCMCILFIVAVVIMNSQQLIFINYEYNFYIKIVFPIVIVIILNLTIFKEINGLKITGIIICLIVICILSFYHFFFEQFIYVTEISLNNEQSLLVKEHSLIDEYYIKFYKKQNYIFMRKIVNSPSIVLSRPAFKNGDYNIESENDDEVIIRYKSNRPINDEELIEYEDVIIYLQN